jgi:hypothetical protein
MSTADDLAHLEKVGISTDTVGWEMRFGANHWKYPETVGNDTGVDDINFNSHESSEYAIKRMSAMDEETQEPFMLFEMMEIDIVKADAKAVAQNTSISNLIGGLGEIDTSNWGGDGEFGSGETTTQNQAQLDEIAKKKEEKKVVGIMAGVKNWIKESLSVAERRYTGSIALYMPTDIQINDSMIYNEDTRKLGAGLAGLVGGDSELLNLTVLTDPAVLALGGAALGMIPGVPQAVLTLLGGAVGTIAQTEVQRHTGRVMNPNELVKYQQTSLRTFTFNWTILPDNKDESDQAAGLIKFFRKSAHAKKTSSTLVTVPSHCIVSFHGVKDMIQLPPCFIESVNVTYNPNNTSFFKQGNRPVEIGLSVGLKEIVPIYAHDVEKRGY